MTDNSFGAKVRIYKYNLCRIYCDFDSYEEFNLVDQYLAKNSCDYDKIERTMCISINEISQSYILGEKIAIFLEFKKIKVKRLIIIGETFPRLEREVKSFSDEIKNFDDFIAGFVTQTKLGEIYGKSEIAIDRGLVKVGLKDPNDKRPTSIAYEEGMVIFLPLKNTNRMDFKWCKRMTCYELDSLGWKRKIQDFDDL